MNGAEPPVPDEATRERLDTLRAAADSHHLLRLVYVDLKGKRSERLLRPLGCFYWSSVWTLAAWCETRAGFRNFRVDHIVELQVLDERFSDEPGKTLADLLREIDTEMAERDSSTDA